MTWWRRLLAHFGHSASIGTVELQRTRPKHRRVIAKADRVIEEYRRLDGVLQLYVRRK